MLILSDEQGKQSMKNTNKTNKKNKGASLVEYGMVAGLVAVVGIGAVFQLGLNIGDTFSETNSALLGDIDTTPSTAPVVTPPSIPYAGYFDPETCFEGTSGADELDTLADFGVSCAYGKEGNDRFIGASVAETFIGGPGADEMDGNQGNDTYVFARGDGDDLYLEYQGTDQFVFQEIESSEVTFAVSNQGYDLTLTYPGGSIFGDAVLFSSDGRGLIESMVFDDITYNVTDYLSLAAEAAKSTGSVILTHFDENMTHVESQDGSYAFSGSRNGTDTLNYTESTWGDGVNKVRIRPNTGGTRMDITTSDGDTVQFPFFFYNTGYDWVDITFADGVEPTQQEFVDRAMADQLEQGFATLITTDLEDNIYYYDDDHGDVYIEINSNPYNLYLDFDAADATLQVADDGREFRITSPNGSTIRLRYQFASVGSPRGNVFFNGTQMSTVDQADEAIQNPFASGTVYLTGYDDTFVRNQTDALVYLQGQTGGTDTFEFPGINYNDPNTTAYAYSTYHMEICTNCGLSNEKKTRFHYALSGSTTKYESFVFDGTTVTLDDIRTKYGF